MFRLFKRTLGHATTKQRDYRRRKFLDEKFPTQEKFGAFSNPRRVPRLSPDSAGQSGLAAAADLEQVYMAKFRASEDASAKAGIMEEFVVKIEELQNGISAQVPETKRAVIKELQNTEYRELETPLAQSEIAGKPSPLRDIWMAHSKLNTTVIGDTEIPSYFQSAMEEYNYAKTEAVLIDESYRKVLRISGRDRDIVADHFVSIGVRKLVHGETRFACLLDSKGLILDLCQVSNAGDHISVLTFGVNGTAVGNFLAQYASFARSGGLEVEISAHDDQSHAVFTVYGPTAVEAVQQLAHTRECISAMPNDSHMELLRDLSSEQVVGFVLRSNAIADSFTFAIGDIAVAKHIATYLLKKTTVKRAGAYAFDSLRMEKGFPRAGIDVTPLTTPVKAALVWMVDQEKLRDRKLFGWKQISGQLAKAPSHRRVGFVADEFVHPGCRVLSAPHRRLIGEVTSCAWSPELKRRVCQGFIKPEYAKIDKQIFVSVPYDLPEDLTKDVRSRFLKQGMMRRKFRRLVTCRVISFPVTDATNTAESAQSELRKRRKRLNPTVDMKRQAGRDRKRSELQDPEFLAIESLA